MRFMKARLAGPWERRRVAAATEDPSSLAWPLAKPIRALLVLASVCLSLSAAQAQDAPGGAAEGSEKSELSLEAKQELSAYADTDSVSVFTPAIAGTLRNPIGGWSVSGSYLVDVVTAASVDVVSAASGRWSEVRHAGSVSAGVTPGDLA